MLHGQIIVVCNEIHTIPINTLGGHDVEFVDVKMAEQEIGLRY